MIDNSTATKVQLQIGGDDVYNVAPASSGLITLSGVNAADVTALKSSTALTRATDLGVTLEVTSKGYPLLPAVTFNSTISSATGANGEKYTNNTASDLSNLVGSAGAAVDVLVTTYDTFTITIGGKSATASVVGVSVGGSYTGAVARNAVATALMEAWNDKYSTGSASANMSLWTTITHAGGVLTAPTLKSSASGSRGWGEEVKVTWNAASSDNVSLTTSSNATQTRMSWTIGSTDASTDNTATGRYLIVSVEEAVAGNGKAAPVTTATLTTNIGAITETGMAATSGSTAFRLVTNLIGYGTSAAYTTTSANIFPTDARGDVVTYQAEEEGINVTTGTARFTRTRLHWLG